MEVDMTRTSDGKARRILVLALLGTCLAAGAAAAAEALKINGSSTVNPVVAEAAEVLRREKGMQIEVDTYGGSSGGISALGDGRVAIGMSSRPIDDADRTKYPRVNFHPVAIGEDAVALIVSRDVWEGGVKALSRDQMRQIYESKIHSWKEVGGPDERIVFFNKEPGRGTWEVFAHWLYGDAKKAPNVSFPEVGANEEARTKVASTRGALSQLSASWADGKTVFALAVRDASGKLVPPVPANIASGAYPLSRRLFVITNGEPQGAAKVMIDFLLSPRGQDLVRKQGYQALADVKAPAAQ
jgi:phosphate transport system substrate-binding protein